MSDETARLYTQITLEQPAKVADAVWSKSGRLQGRIDAEREDEQKAKPPA